MGAVEMLTLFSLFGCVCGFYLSVAGFGVTSLGIALLLGVANPLFDGPFTLGFLVLAVVAQQMGYGLTVVGRSLLHAAADRRRSADAAASGTPLTAERDRSQ